jgi:hypothetical protein
MSVTGVLIAALALPASGCGCDDIGCADQYVLVDFGERPVDGFPYEIEVCIDEVCNTQLPARPLADDGRTALPLTFEGLAIDLGIAPLDDDRPVAVTVTLVDGTGTVLVDAAETVTPTRYRATERCGPYCTNIGLRYP